MQKKNWRKLEELIGDCYLTMIGQVKEDNLWNKTFEMFIQCMQEERTENPNFSTELYKLDDETDYICDVSGWLEDYFDTLDMVEDYERIIDVSNQLLELFFWKDDSKSEVYYRKASALSQLGRHDEAIQLCEEWYAKEADNPVAAASLIYSYMGKKEVEKAEKVVDDFYSKSLICTWETDPFYAAASAVYLVNGNKEKHKMFEKEREEFDRKLGEYLYGGDEDEYDDEFDGDLPFDF